MIKILETQITAKMSLAEARALRKLLGETPLGASGQSAIDMSRITLHERELLGAILVALSDTLDGELADRHA